MVRGDVLTQGRIVHVHRDVEFSSFILSYNLLGALRRWGVHMMCNFGVFFSLLGLEECCICQPSLMVSGITVPAVAFPVEEMQQAERAGSSLAPSAGFSMAPLELPALPLERGGNCARLWVGPCASLCEAQILSQHRAPLGLDRTSSSAKVASLTLTASKLSVLPWASCKTEEIVLFSCVLSVTGSSPEDSPGLVAQTA